MIFAKDDWIAENSPIEPERLHAIGVIAFQWNACELGIRILLAALKGPAFQKTWAETANARVGEILDQIDRAVMASIHRNSVDIKGAVRHACTLYRVNGRNRNQFSHFLVSGSKTGLVLYNNKPRDFMEIFSRPPIESDLEDIRKVADEITGCKRYIVALSNYLIAWYYHLPKSLFEPPPVPTKPPVPELHWAPPSQSPAKSKCRR